MKRQKKPHKPGLFKTTLKGRIRWKESVYLTLRCIIQLQELRLFGTVKGNTQISRIKQRIWKQTHTNMPNFDKGMEVIQSRKDGPFDKCCQSNSISIVTHEKMNFELNLTLHTKINSKLIKDLKVKYEAKKLLEKNRRRFLGSRAREKVLILDTENNL